MAKNLYNPQPLGFQLSTNFVAWNQGFCATEWPGFLVYAPAWFDDTPPLTLRMPSIQIVRDAGGGAISSFIAKRVDTGATVITFDHLALAITAFTDNPDFEMLVFDSTTLSAATVGVSFAFDEPMYLVATDGTNTWTSEAFVAFEVEIGGDFPDCDLEQVGKWIKIEASNTCDLGHAYNSEGGLKVMIWAEFERPEYEYQEEGEDDGSRSFVASFKRLEKRVKLSVLCHEGFTDFLNFLPLLGTVTITTADGMYFEATSVTVETNWRTNCLCECNAVFSNDFVTAGGCC